MTEQQNDAVWFFCCRHFLVLAMALLLSALSITPLAYALPPMGIFTQVQSTTYSQAMSIKGFIDNFSGELVGGDTALTHDYVEAGVQYGAWRMSRIMRYDYDLRFSEDTARLNYQIENNLPIDPNDTYHIRLAAEHLRSSGFRLAHQFKFKPGFTLRLGLSWLESEQYYSGSINVTTNRGGLSDSAIADLQAEGQQIELQAQSAATLEDLVALGEPMLALGEEASALLSTSDFSGGASYYYYEPALREDELSSFENVDFSTPQGKGFSLDLSLDWAVTDHWSLGFSIRDFYSEIRWKNTASTELWFDATAAGVDALNLYQQFVEEDVIKRFSGGFFSPLNPTDPDDPAAVLPDRLAAIEAANSSVTVQNQSFTQRLPQQRFYYLRYNSQRWWAAQLQYEVYRTATFYHFRGELWDHLALEVYPSASAYGLEIYHRFGRLRLVADDFDLDAAKYVSLSASLELVF